MHDKADDVVGNSVNKPTDVLFTNVAFIFITAPLTTGKHTRRRELPVSSVLTAGSCPRL
jgi:hypothetical protein